MKPVLASGQVNDGSVILDITTFIDGQQIARVTCNCKAFGQPSKLPDEGGGPIQVASFDSASVADGSSHSLQITVRTSSGLSATATYAFQVDRVGPTTPSSFQQGLYYPDDPDHTVTISWADSGDPDTAPGVSGSGAVSYQARYGLNAGALGTWASTDGPNLDISGVTVGTTVRVEVIAKDQAGNSSATGSGTVTIAAQREDPDLEQLAAQTYATDYGTSMAVAQAWMTVQGRADAIGDQIAASTSGAGYGGAWFDNVNRKVVVNLKAGTSSSGAQSVLNSDGIAADSTITMVSFTQAELDQAYDGIEVQLDDLITSQLIELSRRDEANALDIEIGTDATAAQRTRISQVAAGAPVRVTLTDGTLPNFQTEDVACTDRPEPGASSAALVATCDRPLRGGVDIVGSNVGSNQARAGCTAGFTASAGTSYYLLTAGHCFTGFTNQSSTWYAFPSQGGGAQVGQNSSFIQDNRGDVGLIGPISASSYWRLLGDPKPWIYVTGRGSTRRNAQYRIRSVYYSHAGDYVCASGSASGGHCGKILKVREGKQNFGVVRFCGVQPGDSGAPVVRRGSARGMIVSRSKRTIGPDPCRAKFQSARVAQTLLDVQIKTR